jgi:hypothetical protein
MLHVSTPEGKWGGNLGRDGKREDGLQAGQQTDLSIAAGFLMMNFRIAQQQRESFREQVIAGTESYVDSERPVDQGTGADAPHD